MNEDELLELAYRNEQERRAIERDFNRLAERMRELAQAEGHLNWLSEATQQAMAQLSSLVREHERTKREAEQAFKKATDWGDDGINSLTLTVPIPNYPHDPVLTRDGKNYVIVFRRKSTPEQEAILKKARENLKEKL